MKLSSDTLRYSTQQAMHRTWADSSNVGGACLPTCLLRHPQTSPPTICARSVLLILYKALLRFAEGLCQSTQVRIFVHKLFQAFINLLEVVFINLFRLIFLWFALGILGAWLWAWSAYRLECASIIIKLEFDLYTSVYPAVVDVKTKTSSKSLHKNRHNFHWDRDQNHWSATAIPRTSHSNYHCKVENFGIKSPKSLLLAGGFSDSYISTWSVSMKVWFI